MKVLWVMLRILSLDVVIGAVASGSLVIWWLEHPMAIGWWLSLPLSVWVIYTADHLMDAHRLKERAHTPRHLFHHQHFRSILVCWLIGIGICLFLLPFFINQQILTFGLGMGVLVLGHLGLVRLIGNRISWLFHKELGVGMIYACGIWGAPVLEAQVPFSSPLLLPFLQFFLLAMINLLVFSAYEWEIDELDGHTSFVRAIGKKNTQWLIVGLAIVIIGLGGGVLGQYDFSEKSLKLQGIYLIMLAILLLISFVPGWFQEKERYRTWGDGIFLLPALIWLL